MNKSQQGTPEKQNNPLVSVIIPNYNHGRYLADAIQSVLNQKYAPIEVVVVDDGSIDNSRQVAARFGDQIQYIWQENQGLSAARNTGINVAAGELIALLDADDLYEPNFLSTLTHLLHENPEADAIFCGCQFVDMENNVLPQVANRTTIPSKVYNVLLEGGFFPPLCMLVKKRCYLEVGLFDPQFQGCADWDMWLRLAQVYTIMSSGEVLTRYRVVPTSMSSDPEHMLSDRLAVLAKHLDHPATDSITELSKLEREVYGRSYLSASLDYLQRQNLALAIDYLVKACAYFPSLLTSFAVFYELACGNQPKGYRGNFNTWDSKNNATTLRNLLDALFADETAVWQKYRSVAYGQAYYALASLSYGQHDYRQARQFFWASFRQNSRLLKNSRFIKTWLKSFLGNSFFWKLKQQKTYKHLSGIKV